MPQSLVQVYLHLVFSTKGRRPFLQNEELRNRTHAYLMGVCRHLKVPSLKVGGVADHVHILCRLAKTISIADVIKELKRDSSKWVKTQAQSYKISTGRPVKEHFPSAQHTLKH